MDKKELLTKVVDSIINEDDAGAAEAFKQYATAKVRGILDESAKKPKKDKATDCDNEEEAEEVAAEVIDKSNKDD